MPHKTNKCPLFSVFIDVSCGAGGSTGWGLKLCNQMGDTCLSKCKREDIDVEPLLAEALGVRWAIQVAKDERITSITIHSDAANVVSCINGRSNFATIDMVAQDCRDLMSSMDNVSVVWVDRNQNCDAHNLASLARIVGNRDWVGVAPNSLCFPVNASSLPTSCNVNSCIPARF